MTRFDDLEAVENTKLDAIEEAIQRARENGEDITAEIAQDAWKLWREGVFPDGTPCKRDSVRKDALKLVREVTGIDSQRESFRIHFILDAKVDDPRVPKEDVEEMFGDGTSVKVNA